MKTEGTILLAENLKFLTNLRRLYIGKYYFILELGGNKIEDEGIKVISEKFTIPETFGCCNPY